MNQYVNPIDMLGNYQNHHNMPVQRPTMLDCPLRFRGEYGQQEIERFLDYVHAYKSAKNICDEQCLAEFPYLLEGHAYSWFQLRAKHIELIGFTQMVKLMHSHFVILRNPCDLWLELYHPFIPNGRETLFNFVKHKLEIFAQLSPLQLPDATRVDMIYGLLPKEVQAILPRGDIYNIDDFLRKLKIACESLNAGQLSGNLTVPMPQPIFTSQMPVQPPLPISPPTILIQPPPPPPPPLIPTTATNASTTQSKSSCTQSTIQKPSAPNKIILDADPITSDEDELPFELPDSPKDALASWKAVCNATTKKSEISNNNTISKDTTKQINKPVNNSTETAKQISESISKNTAAVSTKADNKQSKTDSNNKCNETVATAVCNIQSTTNQSNTVAKTSNDMGDKSASTESKSDLTVSNLATENQAATKQSTTDANNGSDAVDEYDEIPNKRLRLSECANSNNENKIAETKQMETVLKSIDNKIADCDQQVEFIEQNIKQEIDSKPSDTDAQMDEPQEFYIEENCNQTIDMDIETNAEYELKNEPEFQIDNEIMDQINNIIGDCVSNDGVSRAASSDEETEPETELTTTATSSSLSSFPTEKTKKKPVRTLTYQKTTQKNNATLAYKPRNSISNTCTLIRNMFTRSTQPFSKDQMAICHDNSSPLPPQQKSSSELKNEKQANTDVTEKTPETCRPRCARCRRRTHLTANCTVAQMGKSTAELNAATSPATMASATAKTSNNIISTNIIVPVSGGPENIHSISIAKNVPADAPTPSYDPQLHLKTKLISAENLPTKTHQTRLRSSTAVNGNSIVDGTTPKCHKCGMLGFYKSICPKCSPIYHYKPQSSGGNVRL